MPRLSLAARFPGAMSEFVAWGLAQIGRAMTAADEARARRTMWQTAKIFTSYFDRFDIMLSPVLAAPPLKIGHNRITGAEEFLFRILNAAKMPWLMKAALKAVEAKSFAFAGLYGAVQRDRPARHVRAPVLDAGRAAHRHPLRGKARRGRAAVAARAPA